MKLDALFFGAHPDDVELSCGGTVAKLVKLGYKVGICDITRGEAGTRGNAEIRNKEADEAGKILGIEVRSNLDLPDTLFQNDRASQIEVIRIIRKYQPEFVFAPYWNDRHPDHIRASELVRDASFYAGLARIESIEDELAQIPFRPKKNIYYPTRYEFNRADGHVFIVDITETLEIKMKAMAAFGSQFYNPNYKSSDPQTYLSSPEFTSAIIERAAHFGSRIDAKYGEAFLTKESLAVRDPIDFFKAGGDSNKLGFA